MPGGGAALAGQAVSPPSGQCRACSLEEAAGLPVSRGACTPGKDARTAGSPAGLFVGAAASGREMGRKKSLLLGALLEVEYKGEEDGDGKRRRNSREPGVERNATGERVDLRLRCMRQCVDALEGQKGEQRSGHSAAKRRREQAEGRETEETEETEEERG
ncbi:hypothetical protein TGPRC2_424080 [Toxoplasma gondii TgCatPRC2]|uniref:Uncharacterized protein n=1 Tax=Toxoplasma gondii TgCatPRC2 TaxID=1130821 RepID=A0A151HJD9_TOXGO|nr:hypothetical protein TGPRC2_424080 [Toxoplasma gondii TgCatPRC2]